MANSYGKSEDRLTQNNTGSMKDILRRYVASREKIDRNIDFIMVFTNLLSQYQACAGDDEILVDLYAIGYLNRMLHDKVLDIMEELDHFIPLGDAMGAVFEEETKDP